MKSPKLYLVTAIITVLGIFAAKYYIPKINTHYSDPIKCTTVLDGNGQHEYCLSDDYRVPLDCFFDDDKADFRCHTLIDLAKQNEKSFAFELFGHEIFVKRIIK